MQVLQTQLEALGLTPNEAKVYLAGLGLGAATAQQLAGKAAVVRPTAYVAIGGLVKRGLMSQFTKGKKQYFQSEKPARLSHLLESEKRSLASREARLKDALPMLEALLSNSVEKPEVKYYEGWEGLETMRNTLLDSGVKNFDVIRYQNVASSDADRLPAEKAIGYNVKLKKMAIRYRQINVGKIDFFKKWKAHVTDSGNRYKFYPTNDMKASSEIAVFADCVTLISYQNQPYGCLVKSRDIATLIRLMFDGLWNSKKALDLKGA